MSREWKNNLKWAAFFAALCALCLAVILWRGSSAGDVAKITLDGEVVEVFRLDKPREFRIDSKDGGYNLIRVDNGRVAVVEADCPDKLCVRRGYISAGDLPVICLPHRLTVEVEGGAAKVDAVTGV